MWKYLLAWFPMVLIAVANGALRDFVYGRWISETAAHQVSTAGAAVLLGFYMWFVVRALKPATSWRAFLLGLLWLCMTLAFEFLFGHYVAGNSWETLLADYDLPSGRVWVLLLGWIALAPLLFHRLQTKTTGERRVW